MDPEWSIWVRRGLVFGRDSCKNQRDSASLRAEQSSSQTIKGVHVANYASSLGKPHALYAEIVLTCIVDHDIQSPIRGDGESNR